MQSIEGNMYIRVCATLFGLHIFYAHSLSVKSSQSHHALPLFVNYP